MIVKRKWIHGIKGTPYTVARSGWFLFGFIPLYVIDHGYWPLGTFRG